MLLLGFIYAAPGKLYNGNAFQRIRHALEYKNASNTSVLPLDNGPLLTLWEGGFPYALDPNTLET